MHGDKTIMGQTLTRYFANIRFRIINGMLFLCTSPVCSPPKTVFCPFRVPGTEWTKVSPKLFSFKNFFKRFYLFTFRERGKEGGRGGETSS